METRQPDSSLVRRRTFGTVVAVLVVLAILPLPAQRSGRGAGGGANVQVDLLPGNAANGKALVESNKCLDCHRIGETGSRLGPDLSNVGVLRSADELELAIVAPDDAVRPEHRFVRVVTKDGATTTGRILNQDTFTVQLMDSKEELKSYSRSNLREVTILDKGLMPSYKDKLTRSQVADIVNYLASLRGERGGPPGLRAASEPVGVQGSPTMAGLEGVAQ
jgi:putative heme-binding domain-containing protein